MHGEKIRPTTTLRALFEVGTEVGRKIDLLDGFLKAILETAFDPIILVDEEGKITDLSPTAAALFGYDAKDLRGSHLSIIIPTRFREQHRSAILHQVEVQHTPVEVVGDRCTYGLRRDGTEVKVSLRVGSYRSQVGLCHVAYIREVFEV